MVQPLFIANWKMHKTIVEAEAFVTALANVTWPAGSTVVICPPFTALAKIQSLLATTAIKLGAQNMHWADQGAYTGEISASMLKECGCQYVIVGHSERRRDDQETDVTVQRKVQAALRHGLMPIICVGETLEQRQSGQTDAVVTRQVQTAIAGCEAAASFVVAYEPIWAIGTGLAATPEQAQTVHALIRSLTTPTTAIVYGGSVNANNIAALMHQPDINGALVGGASLQPTDFSQLIKNGLMK